MTLNRSRLTEFLTPPAANPVTLLPRSLNGWIIIVDPEKSIYPVVGAMALSGNPYDGHTLTGVLQQVRRMNVLLCCAGHNLRLILKRLRFFCLDLWGRFRASIRCWEGANRLIKQI